MILTEKLQQIIDRVSVLTKSVQERLKQLFHYLRTVILESPYITGTTVIDTLRLLRDTFIAKDESVEQLFRDIVLSSADVLSIATNHWTQSQKTDTITKCKGYMATIEDNSQVLLDSLVIKAVPVLAMHISESSPHWEPIFPIFFELIIDKFLERFSTAFRRYEEEIQKLITEQNEESKLSKIELDSIEKSLADLKHKELNGMKAFKVSRDNINHSQNFIVEFERFVQLAFQKFEKVNYNYNLSIFMTKYSSISACVGSRVAD